MVITNLVKHFQTQSLWINSNVPAICLLLETTPVRLADDLKTFGLVVPRARVKETILTKHWTRLLTIELMSPAQISSD